jgi:hypothetical protein
VVLENSEDNRMMGGGGLCWAAKRGEIKRTGYKRKKNKPRAVTVKLINCSIRFTHP